MTHSISATVSLASRAGAASAVALCAIALVPSAASAQCLPVTGCERPEFAALDQAMLDFMCDNSVPGATLAVAYDGELIYERGFGTSNLAQTLPMQPDAMMRMASVSKPLTVSAVRSLIDQGAFTIGSYAFDLDQPEGGLLEVSPFPSLGDARLADITVEHLIRHRGGWNRAIAGDLTYREVLIADAMGVDSPPGRQNTIDWILGQPLQFAPGSESSYSNIGCLVLGIIVEQHTGLPLDEAIDQLVLGPVGVVDAEHEAGRTFLDDHNPREPWYHTTRTATNVFDPEGPATPAPYGSWDHEARIGQGGQIASARALATVAAHRWVNGSSMGIPKPPTLRGAWRWNHTGALEGTGALIRQRGDGVTYAVLFNSSTSGSTIRGVLDPVFDAILPAMPTTPPPCCPADANNDGVVTPADFNAWIIAYNNQSPACDQNGDGACTPADFNGWIIHFNDANSGDC